jgi:hypothetical protein
MKGLKIAMAFSLAVILGACGQSNDNPLQDVLAVVVNSLGENLSLIAPGKPPVVDKNAVAVGQAPNQVLIRGREALVLSSMTNSLEVIDVKTWEVVRQYSLGDGCSPYLMALTSTDTLLVTCWMSNTLLEVDPEADIAGSPVLQSLDLPGGSDLLPFDPQLPGEASPQGVVVVGHKAYITLSNLRYDPDLQFMVPAGPGFVLVVDAAAWTADRLIELTKTNPAMIYQPNSGGKLLYVPCSGAFDGTGVVEVIDTDSGTVADTVEVGGAPGRMWVDRDGIAWVGDQLDGQLLKFDTATKQVQDPVMLCPADYTNMIYDFIADVGADGRGNVYACCFATDAVHIFPKSDPGSKQVVGVGDGPQAILVIQR